MKLPSIPLLFVFISLCFLASCKASKEASAASPETPTEQTTPEATERQTQAAQERRTQYEAMLVKLNLTEEQDGKMRELTQKYQAQMREMRLNNEGDMSSMRPAMQELRAAYNAELKALLNPEQFELYQEIIQQNRQRRMDQRQGF